MESKDYQQLRLHEESLLAQRLLVFLLANSILFLGFCALIGLPAGIAYLKCLRLTVPIVGSVTCAVVVAQGLGVMKDMDELDKKLGEEKKGWRCFFRGRTIPFWLAGVFFAIWGVSLKIACCL